MCVISLTSDIGCLSVWAQECEISVLALSAGLDIKGTRQGAPHPGEVTSGPKLQQPAKWAGCSVPLTGTLQLPMKIHGQSVL